MVHSKENGINIRYELIKALGSNDLLQEEIQKVYAKNKEEYYKIYRESGFYRDVGFEVYPIRYYRSLQMVSGIVEKCYASNNFIPLQSILKKGFGKLYRYLTQSSRIEYVKVMQYILNGRDFEDVSETELLNNYIIVCYIATKEGKPCQGMDIMTEYINKQREIVLDSLHSYKREEIMTKHNMKDAIYNEIDKKVIEQTGNEIFFGKKNVNLNNILDIYIENDVKELYEKNGLSILTPNEKLYFKLRSESFTMGGNASTIGFYSGLLKSFGFFEQMCLQPITEENRKKFLFLFDSLFRGNQLPKEQRDLYAITSIFLLIVTQEYRDLRDNYLVQYEEEQEYERNHLETSLKDEIEKLKLDNSRLEQKLNAERKQKRESISDLKEKVDRLEKDNKRLKLELEKKSENDNELIALRNYIFEEESSSTEEQPVVQKENIVDVINEHRFIIIGGHENWINKMKIAFPNNEYLSVDEKGRSFEMLKSGNKTVVFNTSTNSHSIYKKMLKNMNPTNKLIYLNGNYNIEKTTHLLYNFVMNSDSNN